MTRKRMPVNVRALRSKLGLTQEEFADRVGVYESTVRRWEARAVSPSKLALRQIRRLMPQAEKPPAPADSQPAAAPGIIPGIA